MSFGSSISSDFSDKGFYVIDLKNRIEWLKCPTGQQWSDEKQECLGEPVKLDFEEIKLQDILNQQLRVLGDFPIERNLKA